MSLMIPEKGRTVIILLRDPDCLAVISMRLSIFLVIGRYSTDTE